MFEYHNRDDNMGTFTWTCARTYNFSHLSRTLIRYSIDVVRCVVMTGPLLSITPFLVIPIIWTELWEWEGNREFSY